MEIIQEALRLGANGYIVKSDAIELLTAIEAIQENRIFPEQEPDRIFASSPRERL